MSDLEEPSEPMNSIDKLTLELLVNKSQYKKYVQKNDFAKYSENQVYLGQLHKYSHKIENLFFSLLHNPEKQITNDINEDFTQFVKTCIQYFELKEMENTAQYHNGDSVEDPTLFGEIDDSISSSSPTSAFHRPHIHKYTMDGYVKLKKS